MTDQSLDGQLEKKEVEIPLPLKERFGKIGVFFFDDQNLEDFLVWICRTKDQPIQKSFSLR